MGPFHPMTLYRPTKADRNRGTYDETIVEAGRTIYAVITVHDAMETLITHRYTDIRVEDWIIADGGTYRVTGESRVLPAFYKNTPVEKKDKPLVPVVVDMSS